MVWRVRGDDRGLGYIFLFLDFKGFCVVGNVFVKLRDCIEFKVSFNGIIIIEVLKLFFIW